jgi:hypothetical protein
MNTLPCHFIWSDGRVSYTLDDLLADADENRGQVAWHLAEGHLQEALVGQGYQQIIDGLDALREAEERVEILLQRLAIFHAMHRRWSVACDFRSYVGRIDKLFRAKGAGLLPSVKGKLDAALDDLVTAVCGVEDSSALPGNDDEDAPLAPTPATPAKAATTKKATKTEKADKPEAAKAEKPAKAEKVEKAEKAKADKPAKAAKKASKQQREEEKLRLSEDTRRMAKAAKDARRLKDE